LTQLKGESHVALTYQPVYTPRSRERLL